MQVLAALEKLSQVELPGTRPGRRHPPWLAEQPRVALTVSRKVLDEATDRTILKRNVEYLVLARFWGEQRGKGGLAAPHSVGPSPYQERLGTQYARIADVLVRAFGHRHMREPLS